MHHDLPPEPDPPDAPAALAARIAALEAEIEALRRRQQREAQLAALSHDWVWEQDAEQRLTRIERRDQADAPARGALIGRRRWEIPGFHADPEALADHQAQLSARQPFYDFEFAMPGPDGERRWLAVSGTPQYDESGWFNGYFGIGRDVTERRNAAAAMLRAKDAAEAASTAKSHFLANISHEIRTPMNGIIGMSELVLASRLDGDQRECVSAIRDSAEWLLDIVNDILDFARLESGRIVLETTAFDPRDLLASALRGCRSRADEKGLALDLAIDPAVPAALTGDPTRLREVVANLVGNAIKFTDRGSVRLVVRPASAASDEPAAPAGADIVRLAFEVIDTGIGIAPEQQAAIFEPFAQADATATRRHGGTGLGLTICARLVAMMGGRLAVTSAPGAGSTFRFDARFGRAAAVTIAAGPHAAVTRAPRRRVLLVEDNPVNQRLAQKLLERAGHRASVAENGAEAVQAWRAALADDPFDLVLMDLQMPVMDGLAAARAIRRVEADSGRAPTPIVAMTANAMTGDRERCLEAGMNDYLAKPVRGEALYRIIASALATRTGAA